MVHEVSEVAENVNVLQEGRLQRRVEVSEKIPFFLGKLDSFKAAS
jgi:hypothetical protein